MTPDVILGCGSVHITDHQLVIIRIEVDFCLDFKALKAIDHRIHTKVQVQFFDLLLAQKLRMDIPLLIKLESDVLNKLLVDYDFDMTFVSGVVGAKADQEWCCPI